jgi:hypothetical protein
MAPNWLKSSSGAQQKKAKESRKGSKNELEKSD